MKCLKRKAEGDPFSKQHPGFVQEQRWATDTGTVTTTEAQAMH